MAAALLARMTTLATRIAYEGRVFTVAVDRVRLPKGIECDMIMDKGKIVNYQITTPSTLNAAPTDPFGGLGPYEQAIVDTPILESVPDDQIKGIDILRAIRSFDPCMPCTTHMDTGKGIITREINSCGCTLE